MRSLSHYLQHIQIDLFPAIEEVLGQLSPSEKRLVKILEVVQIERLVNTPPEGLAGRPLNDRRPIARAFVAKSVLGLPSTRSLLQVLSGSPVLRKICGWSHLQDVPGESTFSRAFGEFADGELCQRVHELLVKEVFDGHLVGHVCRDSTAIEAPERPPSRKKGERRKRKKPSKRVSRQLSGMSVDEMVAELPKKSGWGCKINSRGHKYFWPGYKLHVDWADCGIPISCLISSASLHDSQAAIPLASLTSERVQSLYDLMDSAYDSRQIKEHSESLGHVPIIEMVRRGGFDTRPDLPTYRTERLKVRTFAEQGFGRLKESIGARSVRVRGATRVMTHLMLGALVLTADRILALAT
ncbi:MAG: transposase [bacterium]|nr:transposase [bacterium]